MLEDGATTFRAWFDRTSGLFAVARSNLVRELKPSNSLIAGSGKRLALAFLSFGGLRDLRLERIVEAIGSGA